MLALLLQETQSLVAMHDDQDVLRYANRAYREAFGIGENEAPQWADMMRRNHRAGRGAVISDPDFDTWLVSVLSRRAKLPHRAYEADLSDGRWIWVVETLLPNGWNLYIGTDVTGLRESERDLRQGRDRALREAQTDPLTGVSNRRYMMGALDALVGRPVSEPGDCVCLLDIDHFKKINDRFGHDVGDAVLVDFARTVRHSIRHVDSFGRIGGEEFMLILPGIDLADAAALVDRLLNTIRDRTPLGDEPGFSYTLSAGIVERRADDTARGFYARADQALYDAKQAGRDRIHVEDRRAAA